MHIFAPEVSNSAIDKIGVKVCAKQISWSLRNCYHKPSAKLMVAPLAKTHSPSWSAIDTNITIMLKMN